MRGVEATRMKLLRGSFVLRKSFVRVTGSKSFRLRQLNIPQSFLVTQISCSRTCRSRSGPKQSRSVTTYALNPPNGLAPGSIPLGSEPGSEAGEENIGGRTRLGRFVNGRVDSLRDRWREVRKAAWLKVFVFLLGFFLANAISTVIGQTGDWDIIVAGVLVSLVEVFGSFVYKLKPDPKSRMEKVTRETLQLMNYLKAGLVFALFVDAFKVGS